MSVTLGAGLRALNYFCKILEIYDLKLDFSMQREMQQQ